MLDKYNHCYNYEESIIHNMNPIVKIISFIVYIIVLCFKFNNILFICNISLVLGFVLFSNINVFKYLKVIWNFKLLLIFLYIFFLYKNYSWMSITYILLYVVFTILFVYVIILSTTKEDLSNSLGSIFNIGIYKERIKYWFYKLLCFKELFIINLNKRVDNIEYNGFDIRYRSFIVRWGLVLSSIKDIYRDSKKDLRKRERYILKKGFNGYNKRNNYHKKLSFIDYVIVLYDVFLIVYYIMVVR